MKARDYGAGLEIWKFGGAALADARAIQKAVDRIAEHDGPLVVVASALAGVTDLLLSADPDAADTLRRKHEQAARALVPAGPARTRLIAEIDSSAREYQDVCGRCAILGHLSPRALDTLDGPRRAVVGAPARSGADAPQARGRVQYVDALDIIRTNDVHGGATPLFDETRKASRRRPAAADHVGHHRRGPRLHRPRPRRQHHDARPRRDRPHRDDARAIARRAPGDAVEGRARHHDGGSADGRRRARHPAAASSRGRGSRALRREGAAPARADSDRRHAHHAARALVHRSVLAGHRSVGAPVIEGVSGEVARGAARAGGDHGRRPRHGRRARHCRAHVRVGVAPKGLSVSTIFQASSESSIGFTVPEEQADRAVACLRQGLREEMERGWVDGVTARRRMSVIAVVGDGMVGTPGISARVFTALEGGGINVVAIAQGSSERNISFVVAARAGARSGAPRPHRVSALEDRRRPSRCRDAHGHRAAWLRPRRPGPGRSDRGVAIDQRRASSACSIARAYVFDNRGLSRARLLRLARAKEGGALLSALGGRAASAADALAFMADHAVSRPVVVDVTSDDTAGVSQDRGREGIRSGPGEQEAARGRARRLRRTW